jgi:tetrahydromethanopterin S-methyltransferase subunit E
MLEKAVYQMNTSSLYARVTALVTLFTGMLCFGMVMWLDDVPNTHEAKLMMSILGIAFLLIGILVEVVYLMIGEEVDREARRLRDYRHKDR